MKSRWKSSLSPFSLAAALVLSSASSAQSRDVEPTPYTDEEQGGSGSRRQLPERSRPTQLWSYRTEDETRGQYDDPYKGLAVELIGGLLLADSSRGNLVDPAFTKGARVTWEFGRLIPAEGYSDALFLEAAWTYAFLREGTQEIFGDSNYHYFTLAQAFQLPLGKLPAGFYVQLGAGVAYQYSALHYRDENIPLNGMKLLLQYGVGVRMWPSVNKSVKTSFRFELTRFRRGYMDDTLLAVSAGLAI